MSESITVSEPSQHDVRGSKSGGIIDRRHTIRFRRQCYTGIRSVPNAGSIHIPTIKLDSKWKEDNGYSQSSHPRLNNLEIDGSDGSEQLVNGHALLNHRLLFKILHQSFQSLSVFFNTIRPAVSTESLSDLVQLCRKPG